MKVKLLKIENDLAMAMRTYSFEREDGKIAEAVVLLSSLMKGKTWDYLKPGMFVRGLKQLPSGFLNPESDISIVPNGMEDVAEVTRIDAPRKSYNGDTVFTRVCFRLYGHTDEFAKTDVCGNFRNRPKWDELIKKGLGTQITGWRLMPGKIPQTIDADSNIKIV